VNYKQSYGDKQRDEQKRSKAKQAVKPVEPAGQKVPSITEVKSPNLIDSAHK
jgi:hypothetical protein